MRIFYSLLLIVISLAGSASDGAGAEPADRYEVEATQADGPSIQQLQSFQQVAATARTRGVPILIVFCSFWCQHCDVLEQQVLKPMMLNDKYRERILLKKLLVDSDSTITGFDGEQYGADEFSKMYKVDLYPTMVFFDAGGREVSQRIVGMTLVEQVVDKLDRAIDKAEQALKDTL
jgi:thioredoxin-related protein